MRGLIRSTEFAYGVALAATALAALVRWLLDPWLGLHLPYTTFLVAVIVSGWVGGWGPALLSAVLGFFTSLYLFVPPRFSFSVAQANEQVIVGFVLYGTATALVIGVIEAMHRAQHGARRQQRLWQTTLTSIGDAVATTDTEGEITFLNPMAERLTGWTLAQAAGKPLAEVLRILNESTRAPIPDIVARVMALGQVVGLGNHSVLVARDGSELPIDDSAAPIRDEEGAVAGVVLVFRDVTARRNAERERQLAQDHVIATLESIPDAFMRVDGDWRIEYVNNQYERRFGRLRASQIGKVLWDEWPDMAGTEAEARLRHAMMDREMVEFENYYTPWSRWFAVKVCPTTDGDLAVFSQDITDRKQAEEALRASEQRFRLAAEAVNGIIYDYNVVNGNVERSQGLFEVLGYQPAEVPATADWWWEQVHPDDRAGLAAHCTPPALRAVGRELYVYRVRHRDGHYIHLSDRSLAVRDEQGRLVRQVGCGIDISALKEAETQLREADRRKDEFLATLAHELRNPLAPISNAVQFLKTKAAPDPSAAWGLGVIERQSQNMARLLDDLLDVSRIARNKLVLRRETVDLASVLQHAIETSRPLIDMAGHELTVTLPPEPVQLDADPMRLAQVFSNLLTNAAKYTPGGGHIHVGAAREGDRVMVSVRDDGIGIAPDMLPRLFEIFSQAETALERSQGGLGIGLSLVHGLVELHGGSIEAHSEGVGQGSEFIVRLPVHAQGGAGGHPGLEPGRCRILIADDNHDGADSMALTLEGMGHAVCTAYDGDEALAVANERHPDVMLLDIGMPKKNGYDVCRAIRATDWGRDVTLIALTGWGQDEDRLRARQAGFNHHLVKPVDVAALSELIAATQLRPH